MALSFFESFANTFNPAFQRAASQAPQAIASQRVANAAERNAAREQQQFEARQADMDRIRAVLVTKGDGAVSALANDTRVTQGAIAEGQKAARDEARTNQIFAQLDSLANTEPGNARQAALMPFFPLVAPNARAYLEKATGEELRNLASRGREGYKSGALDDAAVVRSLSNPEAFSQAITAAAGETNRRNQDPVAYDSESTLRALNNELRKTGEQINKVQSMYGVMQDPGSLDILAKHAAVLQDRYNSLVAERQKLVSPKLAEVIQGDLTQNIAFDTVTGQPVVRGEGPRNVVLQQQGQNARQEQALVEKSRQFDSREKRLASQFDITQKGVEARAKDSQQARQPKGLAEPVGGSAEEKRGASAEQRGRVVVIYDRVRRGEISEAQAMALLQEYGITSEQADNTLKALGIIDD